MSFSPPPLRGQVLGQRGRPGQQEDPAQAQEVPDASAHATVRPG